MLVRSSRSRFRNTSCPLESGKREFFWEMALEAFASERAAM